MFSFVIILLAILGLLILPLFAIYHIITHSFKDQNKIIWILIVIFMPFLGSLLYFSIGQNQIIK